MKPYWETPHDGGQNWTVIWCVFIVLCLFLIDGDWFGSNPYLALGIIFFGIIPSIFLDRQWKKMKQKRWEEINDHIEYVVMLKMAEQEQEDMEGVD
ncbi:MAG: hypothetical protein QGG48_07340 [Desulfatiglandales bacterium]|nr:hypothetical protein [Desulfatiglandales bacterium]